LMDRPIYALRARGFDNEPHFSNITEAVMKYSDAIKDKQTEGPYAIAGYSYGAMLAFEVSKVFESRGDEVRFLGAFNLPPHIKFRMRQLNWNTVLLHLAYFLGLITEEHAETISSGFVGLSREEAMSRIIAIADKDRMIELAVDEDKAANWADLAYGLQSMAVDYDPSGSVECIDVFHAVPLMAVAKSREDWVNNHLKKWEEFVRREVKFHEVGGAHYTMLGPEHVETFAVTLKEALKTRGL
jgi:thioesterase domain-containing protein